MSEAERGKIPIFGSGLNPWVSKTIECKKKYGPSKARTMQKWLTCEHAATALRDHKIPKLSFQKNLTFESAYNMVF